MNAVPVSLKRAIGVGIGLFILFIGFANGGLIKSQRSRNARHVAFPDRRRRSGCSSPAC